MIGKCVWLLYGGGRRLSCEASLKSTTTCVILHWYCFAASEKSSGLERLMVRWIEGGRVIKNWTQSYSLVLRVNPEENCLRVVTHSCPWVYVCWDRFDLTGYCLDCCRYTTSRCLMLWWNGDIVGFG